MRGPVLDYLGETKLELGPVKRDGGAGTPWSAATDEDGIAWLVLDTRGGGPNTVSEKVLRDLASEVDRLANERPKALVIRSAKPAGFAAGADIGGFRDMAEAGASELLRQGHDVLDRIEKLPLPTICIVHGAALGAGFEIALACDRRIAIDGASFGFPEVRLGLHPGLGGTFRLTGLIDPVEAMRMMLTGKTAHTGKARKLGIVDAVIEERHVRNAVRAAAAGDLDGNRRGMAAQAFRAKPARTLAARRMREETEKEAPRRHYPAPHALIDLWEEHGGDRDAMQAAEIASFASLMDTDTSRNLIRVFFLRQKLKDAGRGESGIARVHVVGAGSMGADIAAWSALKGMRVTLSDVDDDALARAVKSARSVCEGAHLSRVDTRDAMDRLMPDPNGYGLAAADLVIEAVPETADLKRKIYAGLDGMRPDAILASNTSSLDLSDFAEDVPDAARFAGLHFFNPVPKMQLVEVVRPDAASDEVADRLAAFCGDIDRLPARVGNAPGFLVNRALTPYLLEAMVLVDEGMEKERIDGAAIAFGMPMGPIALADQVGLDICLGVAESLSGRVDKPMAEIPGWLRQMVESGETGRKAGKGFYDWTNGKPRPEAMEDPELADRLILPMLDACVECLRKDVVRDADETDGAMIFATGFAPFRGGPMHYARARGPSGISARLAALAEAHGARFRPDPGWQNLG